MKKICLLLFFSALTFYAYPRLLTEAIIENDVSATFTSKGGHSGLCIRSEITNKTNSLLKLLVRPADRLISQDVNEQDIILTRKVVIQLAPYETKNTILYGYCCQSKNRSPKSGSNFKLSRDTSRHMQILCNALDSLRPNKSTEQSAVWCISDNHKIYSIENLKENKDLLEVISDLTHQEVPWYFVSYKQNSYSAFSNTPDTLIFDYNYIVEKPGYSTLILYDEFGATAIPIFVDNWLETGNYTNQVNWSNENIRNGNFTLKYFHNGNMVEEKKIRI